MLTREQRLSIQVDTSVATRTFRHHVVEGLVRTRDLSDGMQLPTLAGSEITVQIQQQVCYNMSLHEMGELQKYFNHVLDRKIESNFVTESLCFLFEVAFCSQMKNSETKNNNIAQPSYRHRG